jgi:putative ABC transport system permease protein
MQTLIQDLRYAVRTLLKNPGMTAIAVLATALGISANTTIFSSADATMFRPFAFPNQERLAVLFERNPEVGFMRGSVSPGNVAEWREQARTMQEVIVLRNRDFTLTGEGPPERLSAYGVSAPFFDALGVRPLLGRTFQRGEDEAARSQVVVLRHAFWKTRFGGDPHIVGKQLLLDDKPFEVVGVMPEDFEFPYGGAEMWVPFVFEPQMAQDHGGHYLRVLAMLQPGVTLEQANAELEAISKRVQQQFPKESGHIAYGVGLNEHYTRGSRTALPAMIGSALFVLLIACANVANLLLARASTRRKEMAVRLALGASRWRLMRQVLTESVLLALVGGALGCILAIWGIEGISKGIPPGMSKFIPGWNHFELSYTVLAFTAALSVLTGILFGLAPAWQATRTSVNQTLKEAGGRGAQGKGGRSRLRGALVVAELALSLILLVGAGLFVRSFIEILRTDLGIKPDHVMTMNLELPRDRYKEQQRRDLYQSLLERIGAMPGVTDAGAVDMLPMGGSNNSSNFHVVGQPPFESGKEPYTQVRIVEGAYFAAIGTELREGRLFGAQDNAAGLPVVLVNEAFAARYMQGSDAVGQHVQIGGSQFPPCEVVGVVANVMNEDLDDLAEPGVYLPFAQHPSVDMTLIVRAPGVGASIANIVPGVRSELAALDPGLPLSEVKTMEEVVYERRSPKELMMWTLVVFGLTALLMAAVGTYAVMAYSVAQRTHEIGVRMALGARSVDVLELILGQGLKLMILGLAIGLAGAFALTRAVGSLLYGVTATDPLTFAIVASILAAVALLACYIPARRATKVDPMVALRNE